MTVMSICVGVKVKLYKNNSFFPFPVQFASGNGKYRSNAVFLEGCPVVAGSIPGEFSGRNCGEDL
jgi:hypothetical protein